MKLSILVASLQKYLEVYGDGEIRTVDERGMWEPVPLVVAAIEKDENGDLIYKIH